MRPRIRSIKPEIWADEKVGRLSHSARLLLVGLVTMADDDGRLRELPTAILGHVFPYDGLTSRRLCRLLDEISVSGLVVRYVVDGCKYLAFPHWTKHQKVDKPRDSEIPPPPDFDELSSNDRGSVEEHSRPARAGASGPIPSSPPRSSTNNRERELFGYWQERCAHKSAMPTRDRLAKIRARLNEGYTEEQIRTAIDGAARAAYVNDAGKRFDDIELICRNGSKLESFIDRANAKPGGGGEVIEGRFSEYDRAAGL